MTVFVVQSNRGFVEIHMTEKEAMKVAMEKNNITNTMNCEYFFVKKHEIKN